jgi:hypothetical protein
MTKSKPMILEQGGGGDQTPPADQAAESFRPRDILKNG